MKRIIAALFVVFLLTAALLSLTVCAEEAGAVGEAAAAASENLTEADSADTLTAGPGTPAARTDDGEIAEDGINTHVATVWIIAVCSVFFISIISVTILLARKNK